MQEMQDMQVWSLGQEDPLEKGMATHSSITAWRIPWTEEPGRWQSTGSQRVGLDLATKQQQKHVVLRVLFLCQNPHVVHPPGVELLDRCFSVTVHWAGHLGLPNWKEALHVDCWHSYHLRCSSHLKTTRSYSLDIPLDRWLSLSQFSELFHVVTT